MPPGNVSTILLSRYHQAYSSSSLFSSSFETLRRAYPHISCHGFSPNASLLVAILNSLSIILVIASISLYWLGLMPSGYRIRRISPDCPKLFPYAICFSETMEAIVFALVMNLFLGCSFLYDFSKIESIEFFIYESIFD